MALTSSGIPDQAADLKSGKATLDAWSIFLNLFIRVILELLASTSRFEALAGVGGWLMRCNALAGSFSISLYCGLNIFPSLFFGCGYDGAGRSMAMSALSDRALV